MPGDRNATDHKEWVAEVLDILEGIAAKSPIEDRICFFCLRWGWEEHNSNCLWLRAKNLVKL